MSREALPRTSLFLRDRAFYASNRIETLFGCGVTRIDTAARRVHYAGPKGAGSVEYGRLLIATGADAILPPIHGLAVPSKSPGMFARMFGAQPAAGSKRQMLNPIPGLFTLKTITDADGIVSGIEKHRRAVVIGSGFIGLEAAQALARRGIEVTVVEALGHVLPQMLDEEMAERVGKRLADHGVKVLVNSPAETVWWSRGGVHGVRAGGKELDCDIVICAAGVRPGLSYLEGSGIATARGIQVDSRMKTNQPDIYAAGDVIELDGKVLPNWPNAVKTGLIAGLNMMGQDRSHAGLEDFNVVRIFDVPVASFGAREGDYQLRWESPGVLTEDRGDGWKSRWRTALGRCKWHGLLSRAYEEGGRYLRIRGRPGIAAVRLRRLSPPGARCHGGGPLRSTHEDRSGRKGRRR